MNKQETIKLLNDNHNFQLTFKVICFENESLLDEYSQYLTNNNIDYTKIKQIDNSYELLKQSYENNIKNIICLNNIDFLLYQLVVIDNDNVNILKPLVPVYYLTKDNRIASKIKTRCHQLDNIYYEFKDKNVLFKQISLILQK